MQVFVENRCLSSGLQILIKEKPDCKSDLTGVTIQPIKTGFFFFVLLCSYPYPASRYSPYLRGRVRNELYVKTLVPKWAKVIKLLPYVGEVARSDGGV